MNISNDAISVVLPNYNGKKLLRRYLPFLIDSLQNADVMYEIIVVDDCSVDNSIEYLATHFPSIKIVQNNKNCGFSKTCNIGIKSSTYPYVCVCNTDVKFDEKYFTIALQYLKKHRPFAIKGDIFNYIDNEYSNTDRTCKLVFKRGLFRFKGEAEPDNSKFGFSPMQQLVGLGCCFIAERKKLLQLGGFNEIFSPFYWEDSDLCIRAFKRGFTVHYLPACKVQHYSSSTIGQTSKLEFRKLISNRNKFLFTWIHINRMPLIFCHMGYLISNLLIRWIVLDWPFYKALILATKRYAIRRDKVWSSLLAGKLE